MHGAALDEAQAVMEKIKKEVNAVQSFIGEITPSLGAHTGQG